MKAILKISFALLFALFLGSCKDKNAADTTDVADTTAVTSDMPSDTVAVDTVTDSDSPGVTKGEMEQVP